VGFSYGELRDIYYKHHDNEVIKNLFFFIRACNYYYVADILEDESSRKSGKKEAAKIDPNYDGPYAKEVVTFAKNLLGDSYSELSKIAIKEEENYWNLTIEEKKDALSLTGYLFFLHPQAVKRPEDRNSSSPDRFLYLESFQTGRVITSVAPLPSLSDLLHTKAFEIHPQ
jgi:hypothetical protein